MRTRSQSKRTEDEPPPPPPPPGGARRSPEEAEAGPRKRAASRKASETKAKRSCHGATDEFPREDAVERDNKELSHDFSVNECTGGHAEENTTFRGEDRERDAHFDANETDWEDGAISVSEFGGSHCESLRNGLTVEFTESPSSGQRKPSRRASAEEKELAELVHKVHLLCLLARGRLVDRACNDPLIQASLLSLLPSYLLKIAEVSKLTANRLGSLINWFSNNFHIRSQETDRGSFKSNLAFAIETRGGTAEEVAALSVVLLRALNLSARFVSILDVASLKPDSELSECLNQDAPRLDTRIGSPNQVHTPWHVRSSLNKLNINEDTAHELSEKGKCLKQECNASCEKNVLKGLSFTSTSDDYISLASRGQACSDNRDSCGRKIETSKRKGDIEFELELEMALSATAVGGYDRNLGSKSDELCSSPSCLTPFKRLRTCKTEEFPVMNCGSKSAVWSRRTGPSLYWVEVYCSGETLNGRWVHFDAANGIVDGEGKVESAAAAFRKPLKYVVAFAGNGAKDVTRRYCTHWYKIAPQRINKQWWDSVMEPLKELESGASAGMVHLEASLENSPLDIAKNVSTMTDSGDPDEPSTTQEYPVRENSAGRHGTELHLQLSEAVSPEPPAQSRGIISRTLLEDMELQTRALTEPLPTNQLAYKNHHLYVIERWLTKHQVLHPKGPILGYCSGHPVYPRACVQTLQTKHKWLREGLQVKPNEVPAKILKRSKKYVKVQTFEPSASEEDDEAILELYGKWQMEPLNLCPAVNGIVPKNERGQVDVWSEKCLPPGTVHLRLPRLVPVAKRLEIDYAPAMVGFEFRNGRSIPVFEGIVVCKEFKNAILEAYEEEEERREAEERKRNEAQSLSRWFQLLSSIITRQRLENSYVESSSAKIQQNLLHDQKKDMFIPQNNSCEDDKQSRGSGQGSVRDTSSVLASGHDHEHIYPLENQSFDEESFVRTKRCPCGFSIQVEEL